MNDEEWKRRLLFSLCTSFVSNRDPSVEGNRSRSIESGKTITGNELKELLKEVEECVCGTSRSHR